MQTEKELPTNQEEKLTFLEQKTLIYYDRLVEAWINTRMEQDKTFLILSTGGISLLITLLMTVKFTSPWCIGLITLSIIAFLITAIIIALLTFRRNADYIESILQEQESKVAQENKRLAYLDKLTRWTFFIGIGFALASATISATYKFNNLKENHMSENKRTVSQKSISALDSLRDLQNLKPTSNINQDENTSKKSLTNLENLKPEPLTPKPPSNPTPPDKKDS